MKKHACLILLFALAGFDSFAQQINIIPRPNKISVEPGSLAFSTIQNIVYTPETRREAELLQKNLKEGLSVQLPLKAGRNLNNSINLFLDKALLNSLGNEGYQLKVSSSRILIQAATNTGLFYGLQSLQQAIDSTKNSKQIALMTVEDKPRLKWRAFMLDEARYFKGTEQVKLLLDEMARLKMNVFHWHLVDDQGWRIEIKKYPLLTKVGSQRKSTQVGELKWKSSKQSGQPHSGFYTQAEIKEIVAYAADRHINVVPEIEMPGHASAALAAYPWLGTENKPVEVAVKFGRFDDIYDVTNPRVTGFIKDVLQEVFTLFPSKVIHIGGDEVSYEAWTKSEKVNAYMKSKNLKTYADLQVNFTNDISQFIEKNDRRMMGWNEIMGINIHPDFEEKKGDDNAETSLAKNVIVHFWKGDAKLLKQAAQQGYDIVNSLHERTYLDYSYSSISLSKAYDFDPVPKDLDVRFHNQIIGTGSQMWGEWIPTNGEMHYQVFPRLAAFAEVGWTDTASKNYEQFRQALLPILKDWEKRGIHFAPLNEAEGVQN